ncbi:hypothetical protein CDAR_397001 [Caerostris darwini]|uniref:Uncharacterized protein n=1 Tax=Caerostris darwini TaxID=1538125 RepID=A0AAV4Q5S9_9ARAC|nr:hypothetical protein CDAR_397001 [Caerostris darwini]
MKAFQEYVLRGKGRVGGFSTFGESGMGGKRPPNSFGSIPIHSRVAILRNQLLGLPFAGTVPIDRRRAFDLLPPPAFRNDNLFA